MNLRKSNISLWSSLGLTVLLCVAVLVVSTGTAYARYRAVRQEQIAFEVRGLDRYYLGTFKPLSKEEAEAAGVAEGTEVFTTSQPLAWEKVNDTRQLKLTIANGTSDTEFSQNDQIVKLRLVGSLAVWTGDETVQISLHYPSEEDPSKTEILQGAVSRIEEGTALYHSFGDGWIYTFQVTDEEEFFRILPGGEFNYVNLTFVMEGVALPDAVALEPRVIADVIME